MKDNIYIKLLVSDRCISDFIFTIIFQLNNTAEKQKYEQSELLNLTEMAGMIKFFFGNHTIIFIIYKIGIINCVIKMDNKKVYKEDRITIDRANGILIEVIHKLILDEYDASA